MFIHRTPSSTWSALFRLGTCFSVAALQLCCQFPQTLLSYRPLRVSGDTGVSFLFSLREPLNLGGCWGYCPPFPVLTDHILLLEISVKPSTAMVRHCRWRDCFWDCQKRNTVEEDSSLLEPQASQDHLKGLLFSCLKSLSGALSHREAAMLR